MRYATYERWNSDSESKYKWIKSSQTETQLYILLVKFFNYFHYRDSHLDLLLQADGGFVALW